MRWTVWILLTAAVCSPMAAEPQHALAPVAPRAEVPRWGGRIGHIDENGDLRVRMPANPDSAWKTVASGVKSAQLLDWRLAALRADERRTLLLGEGELASPLAEIAGDVCAYQLTLTRVGILQCDGTLLVKEWGFDPKPVAHAVQAFQVLADRVGVLGFDGTLWVQQGGTVVSGGFRRLAGDVRRFQMDLDRIAVLQGEGRGLRLLVGEGDVAELELAVQAEDVRDFDLDVRVDYSADFEKSQRLALVSSRGDLLLGQGTGFPLVLRDAHVGAAHEVQWAGERLAVEGPAGTLRLLRLDAAGSVTGLDSVPERVDAYRVSAEGELLVLAGGRLERFRLRAAVEADTPEAQEAVFGPDTPDRAVDESEGLFRSDDPSDALDLRAVDGDAIVLSSARPLHVRRAMVVPPVDRARVPASVQASPVSFPGPTGDVAIDPAGLPRVSDAASANRLPLGAFDLVGCNTYTCLDGDPYMTAGWAFDPDVSSQSISIHFYVDGVYAGAAAANQYRGDVNAAYGITGNHGWTWRIPAQFTGGVGVRRTITAYALDSTWATTGLHSTTGGSPQSYYGGLKAVSQLTFPLGATTYAENFVRYFPNGGSNSIDVVTGTWWAYNGSWACPTRFTTQSCAPWCAASYGGTASCDSKLDFWRPSTRSDCNIYPNNIDLIWRPINQNDSNYSGRTRGHTRAYINANGTTWWAFGPDTVGRVGYRNSGGGIHYLDFKLVVQERAGKTPNSGVPAGSDWWGRGCGSTTYPFTYRGASFREVYPGEVTPDGYGVVPSTADLSITMKPWQVSMPGTRRYWPGQNNYGADGDAFFSNAVFYNTPVWGGDAGKIGPYCIPGTDCRYLAPRANANYVGGRWQITITGVGTSGSLAQDLADISYDLTNLYGGWSVNSTVEAIVKWIDNQGINPNSVYIWGHSLGALDATLLYQLGYGSKVIAMAPPFQIPYSAQKNDGSGRRIINISNYYDWVSNNPLTSATNQGRRNAGVDLREFSTAPSFTTSVHDRCTYQSIGGTYADVGRLWSGCW